MAKHYLKSTTEVVKHEYETWLKHAKINSNELYISRTIRHANFVDQPLVLWMFIPCDTDGNILVLPSTWDFLSMATQKKAIKNAKKYNEFKDCPLFEGWELKNHKHITNGDHIIDFIDWNLYEYDSDNPVKISKIKDLVNFNILLSQKAVKALGLHANS